MTTVIVPPAGLIGLTQVSGDVGKLIEVGQFLNGDGFKVWEHAFMSLGGGLAVEAEPGGARVVKADKYPVVHWCWGIYGLGSVVQNQQAAYYAKKFTQPGPWGPHGVPYSFLDYQALVLHRLHIPFPGLQGFIATSNHMICSQLVDRAAKLAGIKIFPDDRWDGYVDPLALFNRDQVLASAR